MYIVRLFIVCLLVLPSISNAFCFEDAGDAYGINPSLLESIARVESSLNPGAINRNLNDSIDMGLMQINSFWISRLRLDSGRLLQDPCYNVMVGAKILRLCIDKYGYTWEAVGCYNAVSRQKRINYAWKVFKELSRQETVDSRQETVDSRQSSSFSFSVRDEASVE